MSLLDDISAARNEVQTRANDTVTQMRKTRGVTFDNGDQVDSWDGRFLGADKERLNQLDLLSKAVSDPTWTASLDREVSARKEAGFTAADAGLRSAEDQRRTAAATSGTAAGSWDAVVQAKNQQELARIKATVTQQVDELRAAGIQNLEEMGQQLLSKALAGNEETAAMSSVSAGDANKYATDGLSTQNQADYSSLLSNTIGNFLNNTATPAVTAGFDSASRWNDLQRQNYSDARDAGTYAGTFRDWEAANGGSRSWWGF